MRTAFLPLLLLLATLAAPAAQAGAAERPSLVVVMTDDQTLADMDAMPETRRLIGDAGATFSSAYVSYPLCCPSRATILTGRYAHNHGVRSTAPPSGGVEALEAEHTLPVWLERAGYDTSHVGKYLNGYGLRSEADIPPGWTDWHATIDKSTYGMWGYRMNDNGIESTYGSFGVEDPALYQTDVLRDKALDFIRSHGGGGDPDPFFLSLNLVAPHGELVPPANSTQPYVRPEPRHRGRFAALPFFDFAYDELDVRDKPPYVRNLRRLGPNARLRIERDFRARRESLLAVDEAVAALVAELERAGRLDSTYVLFTSDNGFLQGEHRIPKGKYFAYDPSSHVPLLMRGPGIGPGTVTDELVSNADLAPTLLAAAGAAADRPVDGRSLLPFAEDGTRRSTRPILHEGLVAGDPDRDSSPDGRRPRRAGVYHAVRTRRYLYVQWQGGARELYDRRVDPLELNSVHRDPRYAGVRAALTQEVANLRRCEDSLCRAEVSPVPAPLSRRAVRRRTSGPGRPPAVPESRR